MDPYQILAFCLLISLPSGGIFLFLGYQISVNDKQHWINGVDFSTLSNPTEFTKTIGRSLIITGLIFWLVSLLLYLGVIGYLIFALLLTLVSFLPVLAFIQRKTKGAKYETVER